MSEDQAFCIFNNTCDRTKDTIYAWINKKNMPAHRIGRFWKFKTEEIDLWVHSGGPSETAKDEK